MTVHNLPLDATMENQELIDIIDIEALQSMMDDLYAVTKIGFALIDLRGNVLAANGWQDICTKFHRKNPQSLWNCLESDLVLTQGVRRGEFRTYKCKNRMWDIVTPVIVGNRHVANLFSGQFFFDDEIVDRDSFVQQAEKYGLDKESYLAALDRVPRWNRVIVQNLMKFYVKLAEIISKLSYGNLRLSKALSDQKLIENELRESQHDLKHAQIVANAGSWRLNVHTNKLFWSEEAYRIFGVPIGTPLTYETFLGVIHPEDKEKVDSSWKAALRGEHYDIQHRIIVGKKVLWVHEKAELEFDKEGTLIGGFGTVQDITEQKISEQKLQRLNRALRAISNSNQALMRATDEAAFLQQGCRIIVEDCGYKLVWIGFAENDKEKTVKPMAYAGFDQGYIDSLKITWADNERGRGPTGRAIRTGKVQVCNVMLLDKTFTPWLNQANKRGYASSIVIPFLSNGKAFGALNIYSTETNAFTDEEIKLLVELANDFSHGILLLRMRAANEETKAVLHQTEDRFKKAFLSSPQPMAILRASDAVIISVNDSYVHLFGYDREELVGRTAVEVGMVVDSEKRKAMLSLLQNQGYLHDYEMFYKAKSGNLINLMFSVETVDIGAEKHYLTAVTDITERKKNEQALLYSNQRLKIVSETANRLLSAEDPQTLVDEICKKLMAFLDLDVFLNFLVDQEKACLHLSAYSGLPEETAKKIEWLQFGEAFCGYSAKQGEGIVSENIPLSNDYKTNFVCSFGIKAYVANPLYSKGKIIGTLFFGSKQKLSFNQEELELMKTITAQVSVAMERKLREKH